MPTGRRSSLPSLRIFPDQFPAFAVASAILFVVSGEIYVPTGSDNFDQVYPFVAKWATASRTKLLTVVFDDYEQRITFDVPRDHLAKLNVSVRLASLKQLIRLKHTNPSQDYQTVDTGSCVLLLFSELDHLRDILSSPHLVSFWQPENWYLLQEHGTRLSAYVDRERFSKWALERLWRFRRVYKVLLFSGDKVIRADPIDYAGRHVSYYLNSSCDWYCQKSNHDSFLMIDRPNATDVSDFFEGGRRDFKLCPLKISIFQTVTMTYENGQFGGLDYKYLEEICRKMNVTPVPMVAKDKFGWEENGRFYGALGHLVYEAADVTFNQFFVKDYLTRQIEFTTPITMDKLCVLVPKAPPVPDYLVIFKVFSESAWLLILVVQVTISVIYTMLRSKRSEEVFEKNGKWTSSGSDATARTDSQPWGDLRGSVGIETLEKKTTRKKKKKHGEKNGLRATEQSKTAGPETARETEYPKRLKRVFLSWFASLGKYFTTVFLQLMEPYKSDHAWFPERLLLMCSLFLSLILNGLFTSQLASTFSKRMYYKDIDTLEELEESGLPILTNSRDIIDDALTDATSAIIKRLHKRLQYVNDSEANRRLFESRDAGYLHRLGPVTLKYNARQRELIHVVKECPKEYILANILTKGSPFRDRINTVLGSLNNGGFYWKWYTLLFESQKQADAQMLEMPAHRKISIRHLFIPFAILYLGLGTGVVVFIFERRRSNAR